MGLFGSGSGSGSISNKVVSQSPSQYKRENTFDHRCRISQTVLSKHPTYIPVILERGSRNTDTIPEIPNKKYLIPRTFNMSNFMFMIRTRVKIPAHVGMFLFVDNMLVPANASMETLYHEHKDDDGFLYITYSGESVFG